VRVFVMSRSLRNPSLRSPSLLRLDRLRGLRTTATTHFMTTLTEVRKKGTLFKRELNSDGWEEAGKKPRCLE
jgi:hypothetical protein